MRRRRRPREALAPRPRWYVLEGTEAVPCDDLLLAAQRVEVDRRQVAFTVLPDGRQVSTVFLGMDHAWQGPPMLFETMVFTEAGAGNERRCSTWAEAEAQHREVVEQLTAVKFRV